MSQVLSFGAATLMGLMGSVHCVAMCGGIGSVLSGSGCATARARSEGLAATHAGRLGTYAALGAAAGAAGGALSRALPIAPVQLGARLLAAAVLLGVGLYLAGAVRWWARVESAGGALVAPVVRLLSVPSRPGLLASAGRGAVWGLLPCGLVYGALGLALTSGSAAAGAGTMVAFGAGTLPALLAVGVFAQAFQRWFRHERLRQAAGLFVALSGAVHLAMALMQADVVQVPSEEVRPCCAARAAANEEAR